SVLIAACSGQPEGRTAGCGPSQGLMSQDCPSRGLSGLHLDLGDDAVLLIEELGVGRIPATEVVVDRDERARRRERVRGVVGSLALTDFPPVDHRTEA